MSSVHPELSQSPYAEIPSEVRGPIALEQIQILKDAVNNHGLIPPEQKAWLFADIGDTSGGQARQSGERRTVNTVGHMGRLVTISHMNMEGRELEEVSFVAYQQGMVIGDGHVEAFRAVVFKGDNKELRGAFGARTHAGAKAGKDSLSMTHIINRNTHSADLRIRRSIATHLKTAAR